MTGSMTLDWAEGTADFGSWWLCCWGSAYTIYRLQGHKNMKSSGDKRTLLNDASHPVQETSYELNYNSCSFLFVHIQLHYNYPIKPSSFDKVFWLAACSVCRASSVALWPSPMLSPLLDLHRISQ